MIVLYWLACTSGRITTTELPEARLGEVYSAAIEGRKRRSWRFEGDGLPAGLVLNPTSGILSGVPDERGEFALSVAIADPDGEVRVEEELTLTVRGRREPCGRTERGTFTEVGDDLFDVDTPRPGGWATITLPMPDDDVEQVDFVSPEFRVAQIWLVRPGVTLDPDVAILDQAVFLGFGSATLGWDTSANLGAHQAVDDELQLVVTAREPGDWSMLTECTPGPVLTRDVAGPFRVGDRVSGSFSATKYDEEVRVEALDPLPPGITLSERGNLDGAAEQAGNTPFRIRLTREPTGAETVAEVVIGVYEPVTAACGETVAFASAGGLLGGVSFEANVEGFVALEVPRGDHVGIEVDLALDPLEDPDDVPDVLVLEPEETTFRAFDDNTPSDVLEFSPQSWPPASFYASQSHLRIFVSDFSEAVSGTATVTCDDGPRPAERMPPLVPSGLPSAFELEAIGGTPPYTWSAEGLPAPVTLEPDGPLVATGEDFGSAVLDVTLEDAEGRSTVTELVLWSVDGACDHVIGCGETLSVEGADRDVVCLEPDAVAVSDWVAYEVAHDGSGAPGLFRPGRFDGDPEVSYTRYQGVLRATRGTGGLLFALERYDGRTWPVELRAGGEWTVCATCGSGPVPPNDDLACLQGLAAR